MGVQRGEGGMEQEGEVGCASEVIIRNEVEGEQQATEVSSQVL